MRCQLQNDKGESKFEDGLQRCQTEQRVVISLLDRAEKANDQQNRPDASQDIRDPRQKRISDGALIALLR